MIYFVSDTHFGSPLHQDEYLVERAFASWCDAIAPTAEALYLLGDIFDFWYEYRYVVPKGFVRVLGALARLRDRGVAIHYLVGNHDLWCRDYFQQELGVVLHPYAFEEDLSGKIFRLAHGDEEYRSHSWTEDFLYRLFRNKLAQTLLGALHPRWVIPFGLGSAETSRRRGIKKQYEVDPPLAEEWLVQKAREMMEQQSSIDYYLFGHRHLLANLLLMEGKRCILLGDWLRFNSYASWDGARLQLYHQVSLENPLGVLWTQNL